MFPEPRHSPPPATRALKTKNHVIGDKGVTPVSIDSQAQDGAPIPDPELHRDDDRQRDRRRPPRARAVRDTGVLPEPVLRPHARGGAGSSPPTTPGQAEFIHVEIWKDYQKSVVNQAAADWLLRDGDLTEPWLYLIGADGTIVDRWGPLFDPDEVGGRARRPPDPGLSPPGRLVVRIRVAARTMVRWIRRHRCRRPRPRSRHCYRHPDVQTGVHCTRCGRPICPDCMRSAPVGHHCPTCVDEARKEFRQGPGRRIAIANAKATSVTAALLVAIAGVYVLEVFKGGAGSLLDGPQTLVLVKMGASVGLFPVTNTEIVGIALGQTWRLVSSMFLHAGLLHLLFNMYALWIFGAVMEDELGRARFALIYFLTGLAAGAASYAFMPEVYIPAVGASGAVFGVFGALVAFNWKRRHTALGAARLRSAIFILLINAFIGFSSGGAIDWRAHAGGLRGRTPDGLRRRGLRPVLERTADLRDRVGRGLRRDGRPRRLAHRRDQAAVPRRVLTRACHAPGVGDAVQVALARPEVQPPVPDRRRRLDARVEVELPQERRLAPRIRHVPRVHVAGAVPEDQHAVDDDRRGDRRRADLQLVQDLAGLARRPASTRPAAVEKYTTGP